MRKPVFGKPRSAAAAFSLSRKLPRLKAPLSAATIAVARPHPTVGKPGAPVEHRTPPPLPARVIGCQRCGHPQSLHPTRYVCDKYPHPDPLQICGCETEILAEPCPSCGHSARRHKVRHSCRAGDGCGCWAYDGD
ncbi:MAG TPA: hypothetical protein VII75_08285 [Thermoanaerobaculia bacterium]